MKSRPSGPQPPCGGPDSPESPRVVVEGKGMERERRRVLGKLVRGGQSKVVTGTGDRVPGRNLMSISSRSVRPLGEGVGTGDGCLLTPPPLRLRSNVSSPSSILVSSFDPTTLFSTLGSRGDPRPSLILSVYPFVQTGRRVLRVTDHTLVLRTRSRGGSPLLLGVDWSLPREGKGLGTRPFPKQIGEMLGLSTHCRCADLDKMSTSLTPGLTT